MYKALMILAIASSTACSAFSSPRTTLGTLQDAAIAARQTIRPVIDALCADAKRKCEEGLQLADMSACPEYELCQQVRMVIIDTLEGVQFAITDANLALALSDEDRFEDAIEQARKLLIEIQRQLQILRVIPSDGQR